jgi:hypothetical protein
MARNVWPDRPLGVKLGALVAAGGLGLADDGAENIEAVAAATGSTTRAMGDVQAAMDAVARMATTLQGSAARFRY